MRRTWLLIGAALLATVFAIGAVACDDDGDGDGNGQTPEATAPGQPQPTEQVAATEPAATEPADQDGDAGAGATVIASEHAELGTILTDAQGNTLYRFENDTSNASTCYDQCPDIWPPLVSEDGAPVAGEGVPGELGVTERSDGAMQVTYNGMPLYHYSGDQAPGDANGQGVAGVWFVIEVE